MITSREIKKMRELEKEIKNAMQQLGEVLVQQVIIQQDGEIGADIQLSIRGGGVRGIKLKCNSCRDIDINRRPRKK